MSATTNRTALAVIGIFALAVGLSACEGARYREIVDVPGNGQGGPVFKDEYEKQSIFGQDGLTFGGGKKRDSSAEGGGGIGVNSFLWRASLDTIAFMPVASADPFGGVIITDWYAQPEAPDEQFKLNVYILGRALRADGVKVTVFRREDKGDGVWQDAETPPETGTRIEDAILMQARRLRYETINQ